MIRTQPDAALLELRYIQSESPNPVTRGLSQEGIGEHTGLGVKGCGSLPALPLLGL